MDSVDDHGYYFLMKSKLTGISVSVGLKKEEVEVINLGLKGLSTFSRETTELVILFLLSGGLIDCESVDTVSVG